MNKRELICFTQELQYTQNMILGIRRNFTCFTHIRLIYYGETLLKKLNSSSYMGEVGAIITPFHIFRSTCVPSQYTDISKLRASPLRIWRRRIIPIPIFKKEGFFYLSYNFTHRRPQRWFWFHTCQCYFHNTGKRFHAVVSTQPLIYDLFYFPRIFVPLNVRCHLSNTNTQRYHQSVEEKCT